MQHLYEFQRYLARHRRRHWRIRIITAFVVLASLAAYALTTLVMAQNAHGRAEHELALGGVRPTLPPYIGMLTAEFRSHDCLRRHRVRLLGVAAGAGIVVAVAMGRAVVELQHG